MDAGRGQLVSMGHGLLRLGIVTIGLGLLLRGAAATGGGAAAAAVGGGDREEAIEAFVRQRSSQSIYAQMYGQRASLGDGKPKL